MYKIQLRKNIEGTIEYFLKDKELSEEEKRGTWIGSGAKSLKMDGITSDSTLSRGTNFSRNGNDGLIVRESDLRAGLLGYSPPSAAFPRHRLNARYPKSGRRCAWDCVLSVDKSVSIAALCLPEEHTAQRVAVKSAYDAAIQESFLFLECLARRTNGGKPDIETHSLLAARFDHQSSRWGDPQLHSHLLVMNATCEASDLLFKRWHALESIQLFRQVREIDLVFQRALARHLRSYGFKATLQPVDGLPIAVLPAVTPTICERLSHAHAAIQAEVGIQWKRENRGLIHKRIENMYNEDLRPSKKGSLAVRDKLFRNALLNDEITQITRSLGPAVIPPFDTFVTAPEDEIIRQIAEAGIRLGYLSITPTRITRAALLASANGLDLPYLPYWTAARQHLGRLLAGSVDAISSVEHVHSASRYWRMDIEDAVLNQNHEPKTEHIHYPSHVAPQHTLAALEDETMPPSAKSEIGIETPPPTDVHRLVDLGLPARDSPYALPEVDLQDDQLERSKQSL